MAVWMAVTKVDKKAVSWVPPSVATTAALTAVLTVVSKASSMADLMAASKAPSLVVPLADLMVALTAA